LEGEPVDYCVVSDGRAAAMESPLAELAVCRGSVEMRLLDGRDGQVLATEAVGDQGTAATGPEAAKGTFQAAARSLLLRLLDKAECGSPAATDSSADKPKS
ncbi:MAG: hypothetical protein JXL80_01200, partial [Planctomycetes bacterium]|nr:hypothetical protein [Planctomycetota bacterium]